MKNDETIHGLTREEFEKFTVYSMATNDRRSNLLRAEILGFGGKETEIAPGANVRVDPDRIGRRSFIGLYCYLNGKVTVGDDVLIGPHCSIVAGNHKFDAATGAFTARTEGDGDESVSIGDGSWLCSNVTVTPGCKIGRRNLICAGAVVTKSTPDYAIMAGVPAKQIGRIDPDTGKYLWFDRKGDET